jgi:hypothetical protein
MGAVVAAILLGGVGGMSLGLWGPSLKRYPDPKIELSSVLRAHAWDRVRWERYGTAMVLYDAALALWPQRDPRLERLRSEPKNQAALEAAEAALVDGALERAVDELEQVGQHTLQSSRRSNVESAVRKRCERMLELAELAVLHEGHTPLPAETDRLACARLDGAYALDKLVRTRFAKGRAKEAEAFAHGCSGFDRNCGALEEDIRSFRERFAALDSLPPTQVVELLQDEGLISESSDTSFQLQIRQRSARRLLKSVRAAQARGDWALMYAITSALRFVDPLGTESKEYVDEAAAYAKELYMRGYSIKDTEPGEAIELFQKVVDMTPPDDLYHQKAARRLGVDDAL